LHVGELNEIPRVILMPLLCKRARARALLVTVSQNYSISTLLPTRREFILTTRSINEHFRWCISFCSFRDKVYSFRLMQGNLISIGALLLFYTLLPASFFVKTSARFTEPRATTQEIEIKRSRRGPGDAHRWMTLACNERQKRVLRAARPEEIARLDSSIALPHGVWAHSRPRGGPPPWAPGP